MARPRGLAARASTLLQRQWWQADRTPLAQALRPLSWLYRGLAAWQRERVRPQATPVPVIVVGNIVVGGAGKTPVVIALVQALQAAGRRPGVISRGYGRRGSAVREAAVDADPATVGDEPLLIRRRTGVPVWVGQQRLATARALCVRHPEVDVLVSDDGLQHHALGRVAELVVFDERGIGNGLLLPAGPLRQPVPQVMPARMRVLYTGGAASTPLAGATATRRIDQALPLRAWWAGDETQTVPLQALRGRALLAVAGLAAPEKFFAMLEAGGLDIERLPQPDHARYDTLPWPADELRDIVVTEKDAVKLPLARVGKARVWVLRLDLALPAALVRDLLALLPHPDAS